MKQKRNSLEASIPRILSTSKELTLPTIAEKIGLSKKSSADRRAIQRILLKLIEAGVIQAQGKARARSYFLSRTRENKMPTRKHTIINGSFKNISLSKKSIELLRYLSKPIKTRKPVSYHHTFLRNYIPNRTYYLPREIRKELHSEGFAEPIIRPAGTYARTILNRLLIDLSWNSSRLEGNTYSLLETKRLIELGEKSIGKDASETQMILNHKEAIEYIVESVDEEKITSHEICSIHAILSDNLLGDPSASGRIRRIAVGISGTTYHPLENTHILKEVFDLFIKKINLIKDPFEQSFFSLVHLSYLQAFEDVNKRTARLVSNIPLIKQNLKPLSFIDVSREDYISALIGIYEKNDINLLKDLYVWAYKQSSQRYSAIQKSLGEPDLFKMKFRKEIHEIIRSIIIDTIPGPKLTTTIKNKIQKLKLSEADTQHLFQVIETELIGLHEDNVARFKIRPSEFRKWINH